jgi:hypothetical protein
MKKTLLFAIAIALSSTFVSGQGVDKTWNFSNSPFGAAPTVSFASTFTHDMMVFATDGAALWSLDANNKTLNEIAYTHRLKSGGGGAPAVDSNIPTTRYLAINVGGNSTIKFGMMSSSSSAERALRIVNEAGTLLTTITGVLGSAIGEYTYQYAGAATKLYFYSETGGLNFYVISATNVVAPATTSTENIFVAKGIKMEGRTIKNDAKISIKVFNMLGKEVAKSNENIDLSSIPQGIYIIRAEGSKEVLKIKL